MKTIISLALATSLITGLITTACGIKGDPVPPTKPFEWQKKDNKEKDK